ncbi:MAG: hypothetical protein CEN87_648 [Parcubacteria group bacterium Licking1014_1]|nr:MAG: hypothetical protein CEN87_648 [Parcubacteria group bacterium Licking1014_1]
MSTIGRIYTKDLKELAKTTNEPRPHARAKIFGLREKFLPARRRWKIFRHFNTHTQILLLPGKNRHMSVYITPGT